MLKITDWHREKFREFAQWEIASGGPDPHLKMAASVARQSEDPEWFVGCYTAPYVVATAEILYRKWPREWVLKQPDEFTEWVVKHWEGLPIRKERRVNGTGPTKLATILIQYAQWLEESPLPWTDDFETAYKAVTSVPHHGRYFGMKLYETLRTTVGGLPDWIDIRPKQGSLARRGLALVFPQHNPKDDSPGGLEEANRLSNQLRKERSDMGWFTVEVLLCNYRQAFAGNQYPGRAHDSELGHAKLVQEYWEVNDLKLFRERLQFPHEHLGELQGWSGRRLELGKVMNDHNYVWSDLIYDYKTTTDLSEPVVR